MSTKILLIDYSNVGIIYVGNSLIAANYLKKGLVDTDIRILAEFHVGYTKINRRDIMEDNQHYILTRDNDIVPLTEEGQNEIYLERRRLIKLRGFLMERLCYYTWLVSRKVKISPWDGFENNLQLALDQSDFGNNQFSDAIEEYAYINDISPSSAYKELQLQTENIHSIKMRIYASLIKFSDRINAITEDSQRIQVREEILDRFWRDAWI
jgi:hypothetical protein